MMDPGSIAMLQERRGTGLTWNGQQWVQTTGVPDLVADRNGNVFFQGRPVTPEQYQRLMAGGPIAAGGNVALNYLAQQVGQPEPFNVGNVPYINPPPASRLGLPTFISPPVVEHKPIDFAITPEMVDAYTTARTGYTVPVLEEQRDQAVRWALGQMASQGIAGTAGINEVAQTIAKPYNDRIFNEQQTARAAAIAWGADTEFKRAVQNEANRMQVALTNSGFDYNAQQEAVRTLMQYDIAREELSLTARGQDINARMANLNAFLGVLGIQFKDAVDIRDREQSVLNTLYGAYQFETQRDLTERELMANIAQSNVNALLQWWAILQRAGEFTQQRGENRSGGGFGLGVNFLPI